VNPEYLFQVVINDGGTVPDPLPAVVRRNADALKELYPSARYRLYDRDDLRAFLSANFSTDVSRAFETLAPYAYKADLARYCLLLANGGLYCDLSVRFLERMTVPERVGLVAFRNASPSALGQLAIVNSVILARAGRPELRTAIDMIVANCSELYYGASPLAPTGPVLLARAIMACNDFDAYHFGDYREASPELSPRRNPIYLTPDGTLFALAKTAPGGDLSALGLTGVNNYNEFWHARRVYGERGAVRWRHDAHQIRTGTGTWTAQGIEFDSTTRGCVVYGPYTNLMPGNYAVTMQFRPGTRLDDASVDVVAFAGRQIVKLLEPGLLMLDDSGCLRFDLNTDRNLAQVEVRLHVAGRSCGRFEALEILAT
jgi:hypothetical protein